MCVSTSSIISSEALIPAIELPTPLAYTLGLSEGIAPATSKLSDEVLSMLLRGVMFVVIGNSLISFFTN
jgi:hypothetical protein